MESCLVNWSYFLRKQISTVRSVDDQTGMLFLERNEDAGDFFLNCISE